MSKTREKVTFSRLQAKLPCRPATATGIHESPELSERDRNAAQAIAAGVRDAKATSTRRIYASAWKQFETWVQAGRHQALPATPQAVALYLDPLVYNGHAIVSIKRACAVIAHFQASDGILKADDSARKRKDRPIPTQAAAHLSTVSPRAPG